MGLLSKFFPPSEIGEAKRALDDLSSRAPGSGFGIVRPQVEAMIRASPKEFAALVRRGRRVDHWMVCAVNNLAGDMVQSGEYHVYRGVLGPVGEALLGLFDWTADEAARIGAVDPDFAAKQRTGIRAQIAEVG